MKRVLLIIIPLALSFLPSISQNNPPVVADDTASTFAGVKKNISKWVLFQNDYDPNGNILRLDTAFGNSAHAIITFAGSANNYFMIYYTPDSFFYGMDTVYYVVCDSALCDTGRIFIDVLYMKYESHAYIGINNISARINAGGNLFWDQSQNAGFEVPKGSSAHTIFAHNLWIGGKSSDSTLHIAAVKYRQPGDDFEAGPVMDTSYQNSFEDSLWNRVWRISRAEIEGHILNWNVPGYIIPQVFLDWPAHGDPAKGQSFYLAPFFDRVGDGIYNPSDGDYPLIKGDQAIFFIFNDDRVHMETKSEPLKVEIHGMAYAFDCPADSALQYTLFIDYRIFNQSQNNYDSTYIGFFVDFDIGCAFDDYIESDVCRNSFFAYNGDNVDGNPCSSAPPGDYGTQLPAQSFTLLKGPIADNDGADNNDDCQYSIGNNDGINDNERLALSHILYYCNAGSGGCSGPISDPEYGLEYYKYMKSQWKDSKHLVFGGNGHPSGCFGPWSCVDADFMFPDSSDINSCGTGGVPQIPWNEVAAGNMPGDRRGVGSSGPFTFKPGDTQSVELAFVFGRDYSDTINPSMASVQVMKQRIDAITAMYRNDSTPCGGKFSFSNTTALQQKHKMDVYPNPATDYLSVEIISDNTLKDSHLIFYDVFGREIKSLRFAKNRITININDIADGIYHVTLYQNSQLINVQKVIIAK